MREEYETHMQYCITLARQALRNGNPPVGAIIVHDRQIIGEGIESGKSTGDVTNHAEIIAIREAVAKVKQHLLSQSTLYTTHEPCIMCSYVIRHYNIPHIVYGIPVDYVGGATAGFNVLGTETVPQWGKKPRVTSGIYQADCQRLSKQFLTLRERK